MYIIVVGAGKVGWNLARELLEKEHEVTVIESDRRRYLTVEQELEHNVLYGDASELWVLERAGVQRADMVIAVTGDDEDNILICQVAREKYEVGQIIARVNNPRNRQHFDLLGVKPSISAWWCRSPAGRRPPGSGSQRRCAHSRPTCRRSWSADPETQSDQLRRHVRLEGAQRRGEPLGRQLALLGERHHHAQHPRRANGTMTTLPTPRADIRPGSA